MDRPTQTPNPAGPIDRSIPPRMLACIALAAAHLPLQAPGAAGTKAEAREATQATDATRRVVMLVVEAGMLALLFQGKGRGQGVRM